MQNLQKIINALHLNWVYNPALHAGLVVLFVASAPPAILYFSTSSILSDINPFNVKSPASLKDQEALERSSSGRLDSDHPLGGGNLAGGSGGSGGAGSNSGSGSGGTGGGSETPIDPGGPTDPGGPPVATFKSDCLARSGNKITVSGAQKTTYYANMQQSNTVIDAADATWDGRSSSGGYVNWAITVYGAGSGCWYGGKYAGAWDDTSPNVTWSNPYHHSGAFTIRSSDFLVEGYRAHNQGDGIRMESGGSNFHIRAVYLSDMHDDCIENDFLHSGLLEDSLLDGCYVAFSADDWTDKLNGSSRTWRIEDNLVYLKRMPTVSKGPSPASGLMFKGWAAEAPGPKLVLKNNIFKADAKAGLSLFSGAATLGIPKLAQLAGCENNTFVWLGSGPFPNTLPDCFRVTTDASVWNNAVSDWKTKHPNIR